MMIKLKKLNAMTLVEILVVTSLISMISLVLYNGLSNGIRVWEHSRRLMVEEDIVLFFEKLSQDLRNSLSYSKIAFSSEFNSFAFPTIIRTLDETGSQKNYVDQIGKVEYSYDVSRKKVTRKQAAYGQALDGSFEDPVSVVSGVDRIKFGYIYRTDKEQIYSEKILETIPSAVEIEVFYTENNQKRSLKRIINVPIGN